MLRGLVFVFFNSSSTQPKMTGTLHTDQQPTDTGSQSEERTRQERTMALTSCTLRGPHVPRPRTDLRLLPTAAHRGVQHVCLVLQERACCTATTPQAKPGYPFCVRCRYIAPREATCAITRRCSTTLKRCSSDAEGRRRVWPSQQELHTVHTLRCDAPMTGGQCVS